MDDIRFLVTRFVPAVVYGCHVPDRRNMDCTMLAFFALLHDPIKAAWYINEYIPKMDTDLVIKSKVQSLLGAEPDGPFVGYLDYDDGYPLRLHRPYSHGRDAFNEMLNIFMDERFLCSFATFDSSIEALLKRPSLDFSRMSDIYSRLFKAVRDGAWLISSSHDTHDFLPYFTKRLFLFFGINEIFSKQINDMTWDVFCKAYSIDPYGHVKDWVRINIGDLKDSTTVSGTLQQLGVKVDPFTIDLWINKVSIERPNRSLTNADEKALHDALCFSRNTEKRMPSSSFFGLIMFLKKHTLISVLQVFTWKLQAYRQTSIQSLSA